MTADTPNYGRVFNSFQEVCNFLDGDVPPNQYVPTKTAEVRQATESEAPIEVPSLSSSTKDDDKPLSWRQLRDIEAHSAIQSTPNRMTQETPQSREIAQWGAKRQQKEAKWHEREGQKFRDRVASAQPIPRTTPPKKKASKSQQASSNTPGALRTATSTSDLREQRNSYQHKRFNEYCEQWTSTYNRPPNSQERSSLASAAKYDTERAFANVVVDKKNTKTRTSKTSGTQRNK